MVRQELNRIFRGSFGRRRKASPDSQKGQVTVLIGLMMVTFMLFFCFVINIGMLVNAKINLQNAADLAAYAGASVQARQLTQISYLNYEMRRQYKKFLFRYYVMGNMAQKSHGQLERGGQRVWSPTLDPRDDLGFPAVCVIFNNKNNYCQLVELEKIPIPPAFPGDAIQATLVAQLQQMEALRQENCQDIGRTNKLLLQLWLWNTNPALKNLYEQLDPQQQKNFAPIMGLASGLGLVPKELLIKKRIETLEYYLNFEPQSEVNFGKARQLASRGDTAARERTLQAFYSAYHTLGEHTFDNTESIKLDELTPPKMLELQPITVKFRTYSIDIKPIDNTGNPLAVLDLKNPANCRAFAEPLEVPASFPVGVVKNPRYLTYYALKLQARAKVMFNPFGRDIRLKAYAAAQPFGSRIGPQLTESDFIRQAGGNPIPNLPLEENDSAASGWNKARVINTFYGHFAALGQGGAQGTIPAVITQTDMERAYQAAMAPNPWESGKYNIINDLGDPFVKNFDERTRLHAFWAPIVSEDKLGGGNGLQDDLKVLIDQLVTPSNKAEKTPFNDQKFRDGLLQGLTRYISSNLMDGTGEDGEGFHISVLRDPFSTLPEGSMGPQPLQVGGGLMLREPAKVKTSWNGVKNSETRKQGRTGYSVKFVSFKTLREKNTTTNGQEVWENDLQTDGDSEADVINLDH